MSCRSSGPSPTRLPAAVRERVCTARVYQSEKEGFQMIDATLMSFGSDVFQASMQAPVLVDFWAPWCGPCRQLGPLLEKAVREAKGAVRMVKVNIDESPEIAQQMRIQ